MLQSILTERLTSQRDFEVFSAEAWQGSLAGFLAQHRPHFLVTGTLGAQDRHSTEAMLQADPQLKILTVEGDGRQMTLWQMRPTHRPVGDISLTDVAAVMRAAVGIRVDDPGSMEP